MRKQRCIDTLLVYINFSNQNLNEIKPLLVGKQYDRVADILRETLTPDCKELMHLPNEPTLSRYEQYNLLLTALWESKNYEVS